MKIIKMVNALSSIGYDVIMRKDSKKDTWEVIICHNDWVTNSLNSARILPRSESKDLKAALYYLWYKYYRLKGNK